MTERGALSLERGSVRTLALGAAAALLVWLAERAGLLAGAPRELAVSAFALAALVASLRALRAGRVDERAAWTFISLGTGAWLAGQLVWDLAGLLGSRTVPGPFDPLLLGAAPLFVLGSVGFLVGTGQRLAIVALLLDVGAVVLTLLAGVALGAARVFSELGADPVTMTTALLYPVLFVGATGAALSTLWGMPVARPRASFAGIALAMAVFALTFTLWLPLYLDGTLLPESPFELGLALATVVLAASAQRAVEDRDEVVLSPRWREAIHFSRLLLPGVVAAAAAAVLVASQLDRASATDPVVALCIAATILLLATRAGLALFTNYRLGERERLRAAQYEALYDVGLESASERSVDELVRLVVDRATDLTRTDGSTLALAEPGRGYVIRAQRRPAAGLRDAVGEELAGIGRGAVEARTLVAAQDYAAHPLSNPALHDVIRSAMSAPLVMRGEILGVLSVYATQRREFGEATRRLFRLYAAQAASSIAAARLLEESRVLARQDPLTGLLNRRSLVDRLEAEVAEARRHADAFCVLMADVDGLKDLNDTAGHLVGDEVLRLLGAGLRAAARAEDAVARFGGDEFVLLLPRTSLLQGQALAARIQGRLRDATYVWGGRDRPVPRVSIGVAAFPDDGLTAERLIAAADARMYEDKQRSRGAARALGEG